MHDVVIVGWGPTGMTAACLLGRAGYRVGVFERYKAIYQLPRVGGVHDDVLRIFQEIGISEEVLSAAHILQNYDMVHDGEIIFASPLSAEAAHGWPQQVSLFQPCFEGALDAVAKRSGSVDVCQGQRVVALSQTPDHVEITVEDVVSGKRRTERGRYLIGCDGGNSFVRGVLGIDSEPLGFEQDWLVIDAELKRPRPGWPESRQFCDPEQPGMAMRMGKHHRRWAFMIFPGEALEDAVRPEAVWRRLDRPEGATADEVALIRHASYRFTAQLARRWRVGRVFLAGDAAHQMPPYLGQGMCSGICVGRAVIEQDPEKARQRDLALKAAQAQSTRQWVGYRTPGLTDGFIARASADRCRGAGEVFVQGRVAVGGRRGLFDDLVGRGFLILARRGDPIASLSESHRVFWRALGGRIATFGEAASNAADIHFDDAGGWYGRLLDEAGCDIIVKRPDYHIFGMYGAVADLPAALDDMRAQLMTKATAQPRAPLS